MMFINELTNSHIKNIKYALIVFCFAITIFIERKYWNAETSGVVINFVSIFCFILSVKNIKLLISGMIVFLMLSIWLYYSV